MKWPWQRPRTWVWSPWMSPAEIARVNDLEGPVQVPPPADVYDADGEPVRMMDEGEGLLW